jgi:hypothetical protein
MNNTNFWAGLRSRFAAACLRWPSKRATAAKLIVVVEGLHDVAFLQRISRILYSADSTLLDLGERERAGDLVFLPFGGGDVVAWAQRLAALQLNEIHIYDREAPPETEFRRQAAEMVNRRRGCRAFVTSQRSLENYIHPACIRDVSGLDLSYREDDDAAELVARSCHERQGSVPAWDELPGRARKRFRERAKRWLNRAAVERMTPELLDEVDPVGEVRGWLAAIAELVGEKGGDHAN